MYKSKDSIDHDLLPTKPKVSVAHFRSKHSSVTLNIVGPFFIVTNWNLQQKLSIAETLLFISKLKKCAVPTCM